MRIIAFFLLSLAAAGCVHKIDIQQGNYVTQDLVERLKPGMTKAEVKAILGTPLLTDAFHANRWDYFFSNKPNRKPEEHSRLSVYFESEKMVSVTGNARPAGSTPARSESETPRPTLPPGR